MSSMRPPLQLSSLQNRAATSLLLYCSRIANFTELHHDQLPPLLRLPNLLKTLWQDNSFQETLKCNSHTTPNIGYFISKVEFVFKSGYSPSDEDILRFPATYDPPLREMYLRHDRCNLRIVDFTGSVNITSMWLSYFNGLRSGGLVFLVDCSSFDWVLSDGDRTKNQLRQAFNLFQSLYRLNRYHPVAIVLNKKDLLAEKILAGAKFEEYFPEIENFGPGEGTTEESSASVVRAKAFIVNQMVVLKASLG